MTRFNKSTARPVARGPITTEPTPMLRTHEGAPGYAHDAKSELFLTGVVNFVGQDTFYETGEARDTRYVGLCHMVALADPAWYLSYTRWLRLGGNMRTAALIAAAEGAYARITAGINTGFVNSEHEGRVAQQPRGTTRQLIDAACQRADEPGELLAYWHTRYGRNVPKPVKRGLADAASRLYTAYSALKYDTSGKGYRFADVLELCHPTPATPEQAALFTWLLERRHHPDTLRTEEAPLSMLVANQQVRDAVASGETAWLYDSAALRGAGMTWEDVLSLAGTLPAGKVDKARMWEALAPTMGYMALLRNLRNFDEAGMSNTAARRVAERLADPVNVASSRQLPFRFWSAYKAVQNDRWRVALGDALDASLANLNSLHGAGLAGSAVLVDTSGSMTDTYISGKSTIVPVEVAALFGVALAGAIGGRLFGFADGVFEHNVPKGSSVLSQVDKFVRQVGKVGHGTLIAGAVRHAAAIGFKRIFIISDMQTMDRNVTSAAPSSVPLYGFNLGGYRPTALPTGPNRHEFGSLTDATFRLVPMLEAGRNGVWPWELTTDSVAADVEE